MKIILFRHGEKQKTESKITNDKNDVELTDLGIDQITKLGNTLKQRFPQLNNSVTIYSSLYRRSIQSAEIVQKILNIKNLVSLSEFGEFNAYNNYLNPKEIRQHIQAFALQNPDWIPPETNISLNQSISSFETKIKQLCQQTPDGYILISTHGGIIRNTVYSIDQKYRPSSELIAESKISEAGYTILNFDGQNFSVDQFNVHDFLD